MVDCIFDVITDAGDKWSAGHRVNVTHNSPSSFIWMFQTANYYTKLPISYHAWLPGAPNSVNEFCLSLVRLLNYRWNDAHCASAYNPVCEIDID